MQEWTEIRRKVLVEHATKRSICKEYDIGWRTLDKILTHPEPPGYRAKQPRPKPKLGPFLGVIDQILESDKTAPAKQRHTAKRVFQRLRDEYGYSGGALQVSRYIATKKRHSAEAHVPLSHKPGQAQFDFGFAEVVIAGCQMKVALAVMTLPYSDAFHISAYPKECTETFQAAHVAAFDFFGGVPQRTSYDNSRIAVKKVVGRSERELTTEFLRLESHFLFDHHFCNVGRGNEKGKVESLVGYGRRNTLVPVPHFDSFEHLNAFLAACCYADLFRILRGKTQTKAELLHIDRAALLPIPAHRFEARRVVKARANSLSLVRFDCNDYSVPTAFAHHDVTGLGSIDEVRLVVGTEVVATHPRCWTKEQTIFDPRHYLALLERKPGAFDFARPLERWELPECFSVLRRRLESQMGWEGTREYIRVLRLLEDASLKELTRAVIEALSIGASGVDAISLIIHHRLERPISLFCLDGLPHLKSFALEAPDLCAYRELTA